MRFPTKAIAIYTDKKAGHYYQNNHRGGKSLLIRLDQ